MDTTTNIHDNFLATDFPVHVPLIYDRNKCYSALEPPNMSNNYIIKSFPSYSYTLPYQPVDEGSVVRSAEVSGVIVNLNPRPSISQEVINVNCPMSKPSSSDACTPATPPKKKGRKPKNPNGLSRHENKINRNSNKKYINYKGIEVEPKTFIDFDCKCAKKCNEKVSADERKAEFEKYWALSSYDSQTAFIAAKVSEKPVKKRYGKTESILKSFSRKYCLAYTPVCRIMFVKTLQISTGRINTALTKLRTKHTVKDQRGLRKHLLESIKVEQSMIISESDENSNSSKVRDETPIDEQPNIVTYLATNSLNEQPNSTLPPNEPCITYHENPAHLHLEAAATETGDNASTKFISTSNSYLNSANTSATNNAVMDGCSIIYSDSTENVACNLLKSGSEYQPSSLPFDIKPPTRKGRKPKFATTRKENKANRNSNLPYLNYKGELVEPKKFVDFNCKCTKRCHYNIPAVDRQKEFEKFWALSYDSQTAYIVAAVSEEPVKRRYTKKEETKKDFSRKYALGVDCVCRDMFCRTLNISPGRINTALKKYRLKCPLSDQRGIKQGGRNKLPAEKKNGVVRFMKRIPIYKSHYYKEKSKGKFLPSELTLTKLYDLYKEEEKDNSVSHASFKKFFYSSFNVRSKEACNTCEYLKNQIMKDIQSSKSQQAQLRYNEHKDNVEKSKTQFDHDLLLAKKFPDIECMAFEMGRPLPLPRIPSNSMCYLRPLWFYNMGVYSSKKDQTYCYVWPEGQAGKGAQEVGSCLLKHLKEEVLWWSEISHIILWTDPCGGLNRNIKLILMLKALLHSSPTLKSIKLKYLVPGHNHLPIQRDFGDIEKALRNKNPMYIPEDYMNVIRYCRKKKPLIVKAINNNEFMSTDQLEKHGLKFADGQRLKWSEVNEISMIVNDPYSVYLKTDFHGNGVTLNFEPMFEAQPMINYMHLLVPLWPIGKPVTPAKLKDLKSVMHLIPVQAKNFYSTLQCGTNNDEDVDGFNEHLDFEIEYGPK